MPIKVPDNLPAKEILQNENIFVMGESRAFSQDIRPLKIAILNLMPNKQATEVQLMRLLGNTPLQLEIRLLHMESHESKNTPTEYLKEFYDVFDDVRNQRFDGMIITGAPIEQMPFEEVNYWTELCEIMEWSKTHVTSVFHICWGAQAGLYYHYGIEKYPLENKMFGVFQHYRLKKGRSILRGFDDVFYAPHSRHTEVRAADIEKVANLEILASSDQAGVYLVASKDGRQLFATGHSEYDRLTLHNEYMRDLAKGDVIELPRNYYRGDDPEDRPVMNWRAHSALLYGNWVNLVYQETPYNWIF